MLTNREYAKQLQEIKYLRGFRESSDFVYGRETTVEGFLGAGFSFMASVFDNILGHMARVGHFLGDLLPKYNLASIAKIKEFHSNFEVIVRERPFSDIKREIVPIPLSMEGDIKVLISELNSYFSSKEFTELRMSVRTSRLPKKIVSIASKKDVRQSALVEYRSDSTKKYMGSQGHKYDKLFNSHREKETSPIGDLFRSYKEVKGALDDIESVVENLAQADMASMVEYSREIDVKAKMLASVLEDEDKGFVQKTVLSELVDDINIEADSIAFYGRNIHLLVQCIDTINKIKEASEQEYL